MTPFAKFRSATTKLIGESVDMASGRWVPFSRSLYQVDLNNPTALTATRQQLVAEQARADRRGLRMVLEMTTELIPFDTIEEAMVIVSGEVKDPFMFSGRDSEAGPEIPATESKGDDMGTLEDGIKELIEEKLGEIDSATILAIIDEDELLEKVTTADDWESDVQSAADAGSMIEDRIEQELDRRSFIDMDDVHSAIRDHTSEETHGNSFPGEGSRCELGRAVATVIRSVLMDEETQGILVEMLLGSPDVPFGLTQAANVRLESELLLRRIEAASTGPYIDREVVIALKRLLTVLKRKSEA